MTDHLAPTAYGLTSELAEQVQARDRLGGLVDGYYQVAA
jgi:hypothetical protein